MNARAIKAARAGTAVNAKGKIRAEEILDVAAATLVEDGYAEFTIRKIAAKGNIKPGNLQYYFPTKQDLLVAMLEAEMERYQETMERRVSKRKASPEQQLNFALDYVLGDQKNRRSCALFWELWALSSHDAEVQQVMDGFYDSYVHRLSELAREINPELSVANSVKTSVLIVAMLEGVSLFRGHNRPEKSYLRGIENRIRQHVMALIQGA